MILPDSSLLPMGLEPKIPQESAGQGLSQEQKDKLSTQFESLLVHELVKSMRATVQSGSDDFGVSMSTDMMDQALSDAVAGRLGLGEHLLGQIEAARNPDSAPANQARRIQAPKALPLRAAQPKLPDLAPTRPNTPALPSLDTDPELASFREVYAQRPGVISQIDQDPSGAWRVVVTQADKRSVAYENLDKVHVRRGDRVEAGECIADGLGQTERSTVPASFDLHRFGIKPASDPPAIAAPRKNPQ